MEVKKLPIYMSVNKSFGTVFGHSLGFYFVLIFTTCLYLSIKYWYTKFNFDQAHIMLCFYSQCPHIILNLIISCNFASVICILETTRVILGWELRSLLRMIAR